MHPRVKWQLNPCLDDSLVFQLATNLVRDNLRMIIYLPLNYFLQAKEKSHQGFDVDRDVKKLYKACKGMGMENILLGNLFICWYWYMNSGLHTC
jgi:hypothetical protein